MKFLIIDDHALFREGLCYILKELDTDIEILEAPSYELAMNHIELNSNLDLVLLDLALPNTNGFEILEEITHLYPTLPVVIVSGSKHRSDMQRILDLGAVGYIEKDTGSSVMIAALKLILSGGIYTPPSMFQERRQEPRPKVEFSGSLTPRQEEVSQMLAEGLSNKKIAQKLDISDATVKMHVTAIMKVLGVSNRTQAALEYNTRRRSP